MNKNLKNTKTQKKFRILSTEQQSSETGGTTSRTQSTNIGFIVMKCLHERQIRQVVFNNINYTPKLLEYPANFEKFNQLVDEIEVNFLQKGIRPFPHSREVSLGRSFSVMNITMDDIGAQIGLGVATEDDVPLWRQRSTSSEEVRPPPKMPPYIKVVLRETDDVLLFEQASITVPKDSADAVNVEEDNKIYEYLTVGKGKNRRTADAETQTVDILYKSRHVNTERIKKLNIGSYVSNYDMFDTYANVQHVTTSMETGSQQKLEITTYMKGGVDQFGEIGQSKNFKLATMLIQRLLAGNIYEEKQKRFRNMYLPDPLAANIKYNYRLDDLWCFSADDVNEKAVSSLSWCQTNGDILAVAYGVYSFVEHTDRNSGFVCIWSIKNPVNPERKYKYQISVTSVSFSKQSPQLLAIGLYDGSVEVRDITDEEGPPVWRSERITSPGFEPVGQIEWIPLENHDSPYQEQLLTISQDGTVMKYNMTTGPYLLGFRQIKLTRVEGGVEGISLPFIQKFIEADPHPQAITLKIHPIKTDVFYIGTEEGCIHECSTNYPNQQTQVLQVHNGGVFGFEFSPWSPSIFLTCGSDWCIRIWVEGIFEPLVHLSSGIGPVHCAYWSPIHSTIIVGITKTAVEVWDIRRSTLKPASLKSFGTGFTPLTIAKFSNCGRSLVVGDNEGTIFMCALEDMPFPPHFQYEELESAIFKALVANPKLTRQLKSLGHLGYKEKETSIKNIN